MAFFSRSFFNQNFLHRFCHLSDGAIWCRSTHNENFNCIHKWYRSFLFISEKNGKCEQKCLFSRFFSRRKCWLLIVDYSFQWNFSKCLLKLKSRSTGKPTHPKRKFIISIISWIVNGKLWIIEWKSSLFPRIWSTALNRHACRITFESLLFKVNNWFQEASIVLMNIVWAFDFCLVIFVFFAQITKYIKLHPEMGKSPTSYGHYALFCKLCLFRRNARDVCVLLPLCEMPYTMPPHPWSIIKYSYSYSMLVLQHYHRYSYNLCVRNDKICM